MALDVGYDVNADAMEMAPDVLSAASGLYAEPGVAWQPSRRVCAGERRRPQTERHLGRLSYPTRLSVIDASVFRPCAFGSMEFFGDEGGVLRPC